MAETLANQTQMVDLIFTLRSLLEARGLLRWAVGGATERAGPADSVARPAIDGATPMTARS